MRSIKPERSGAESRIASVSQVSRAPGESPSAEGVCSSRTACALMPAKPKAFTPARRGESGSAWIHGREARVQLERAIGAVEQGVGLLGVQGRRKDAMEEREGGLDQPGDAGGRHGVADHRGDGAQVSLALSRRGEDGAQRAELGAIGGGNAQAVAFDQGDGGGIDPRAAIGAANGAGMAAGAGGGQSLTATVAGHADSLDEGVDSIAVALGVAAALEDDHADSFAGEHPVCGSAEGPSGSASERERPTGGRQAESRRRPRGRRRRRSPESARRERSAVMARSSATRDEALAASTTKLAPERSKRCASRPAVALVSWPGMVAASNGGRLDRRSSAILARSWADHSG